MRSYTYNKWNQKIIEAGQKRILMNQRTDNIFKTKEITGNDTLILVYTATQTNTGRTCLYFFHKTNWNLKK